MKRFVACVLACWLLFSPVVSLAAQSTWDDFDQILTQLENEISSLKQKILDIEGLSIAQSNDLSELRSKLAERERALSELRSLYEASKNSVLSLELKIVRRNRIIVAEGIVILIAGGIAYVAFRGGF